MNSSTKVSSTQGNQNSGTKIPRSTWAMKRKADGTRRARLTTKGCSQRPGLHYDEDNISSPVTNLTSIRLAFVLLLLSAKVGWVKDVNGAFLTGEFQDSDPVLYMNDSHLRLHEFEMSNIQDDSGFLCRNDNMLLVVTL